MDEQEIRRFIGQRIRQAREKRRWSQIELGQKLGKESSSISSYESGTRTIRISDLPRLARLLKVSISYFFGQDEVIENLIAVAQKLNIAGRYYILSQAEKLLQEQQQEEAQVDWSDSLTLVKHRTDGSSTFAKISRNSEDHINELLNSGWEIATLEDE